MLFYQNLEKIIYTRNQLVKCDELVIISGYVGPGPIHELNKLPIKSTVIYGMYGNDGIQRSLHEAIMRENEESDKVNVLYSEIPVHSKCYLWMNEGSIVSALVGSANFSTNGLTTPFKETLADATTDTFEPLEQYLDMILKRTIKCENAVVTENRRLPNSNENSVDYAVFDKDICSMPLFVIENGTPIVKAQSGINWGLAKLNGSHVNINDAYIRIGTELLEDYPLLFPQKQEEPSQEGSRQGHRHNDSIEIIWDDGTVMTGLLEGSVTKEINGKKEVYPKQISSTPSKAQLGKYLRKRLGVDEGYQITYEDLKKYGRTSIDVSLQGEGVYYFDFSVEHSITVDVGNAQVEIDIEKKKEKISSSAISLASKIIEESKTTLIDINVGDTVKHNNYGIGTVLSVIGTRIIVDFDSGEKKFKYPDAFENGVLKKGI